MSGPAGLSTVRLKEASTKKEKTFRGDVCRGCILYQKAVFDDLIIYLL